MLDLGRDHPNFFTRNHVDRFERRRTQGAERVRGSGCGTRNWRPRRRGLSGDATATVEPHVSAGRRHEQPPPLGQTRGAACQRSHPRKRLDGLTTSRESGTSTRVSVFDGPDGQQGKTLRPPTQVRSDGSEDPPEQNEVVRLWNGLPMLHEYRLEVLFHALLRVETHGFRARIEVHVRFAHGDAIVAFRFPNPPAHAWLHRALAPWSRPPGRTGPPPEEPVELPGACGQARRAESGR